MSTMRNMIRYVVQTSGEARDVLVRGVLGVAQVSAILPVLGSTAGGQVVKITVDDSVGATGVSVGGVALTSFSIVDAVTVQGTTGAHGAGASDVIVSNVAGASLPLSGGYQYDTPPVVSAITPNTGATSGGTAITNLAGTGFVNGATVTIGGVAATAVAFVSSIKLTCTTPAGTIGAQNVIVTNPDGLTSGTSGNGLYTYAAASPTVSSIAPNVGDTAGGGGIVTITGTNFTGATGVTIAGVACTSLIVVNATTITCIPGAHAAATLQSVLVTTPSGTNGANTIFEYWTPSQIGSIQGYWDSNKGVTGGGAVSAWTSQSAGAIAMNQATGAAKPAQTASVFGTLPSIRFAAGQFVKAASLIVASSGYSIFWGGKTTTTYGAPGSADVPGTVVGQNGGSNWGAVGYDSGASCGIRSDIFDGVGSTRPSAVRGSGYNDGTVRMHGWTSDTTPNRKAYTGATQQGATFSPAGGYDAVNTAWDSIGAGVAGGDDFVGDLAFVVIDNGVISGADLTKLYAWAQQRFGVA